MSDRRLPVRPDLKQLKHQAKDLLRAVRRGDPAALAETCMVRRIGVAPPSARRFYLTRSQLNSCIGWQVIPGAVPFAAEVRVPLQRSRV